MSEGRRLRIAVISYYLPSDSKIGVGYQAHELANELARRGHHLEMYSPCPPVDGRLYDHHQLLQTGSMRTFRFATALRRVDFSRFDALHAHGDDYWLWRRRVPAHVRTLHGSCFDEAFRITGAKERARMLLLGLSEVTASLVADRTFVVSPETLKWTPWADGVIPNGIDRSHFKEGHSKTAQPTVLFVGTWNGRKRGGELARVFSSTVRKALPSAELLMVTQDAPPEVPDGVRVLGRVSHDALADLYASAWTFCLPSSYEGFGIPYAEALSAGLPVVATPNVGARYVLDEGRSGVLCDLEDLGDALIKLLTDTNVRTELRDSALERATSFDLKMVASLYEHAFASVSHHHGD